MHIAIHKGGDFGALGDGDVLPLPTTNEIKQVEVGGNHNICSSFLFGTPAGSVHKDGAPTACSHGVLRRFAKVAPVE
jgi:hypothetical protein